MYRLIQDSSIKIFVGEKPRYRRFQRLFNFACEVTHECIEAAVSGSPAKFTLNPFYAKVPWPRLNYVRSFGIWIKGYFGIWYVFPNVSCQLSDYENSFIHLEVFN